jgi:hypothetical protein
VVDEFPDLQPLMHMRPFLSVMHAKAHTAKCEVPEIIIMLYIALLTLSKSAMK